MPGHQCRFPLGEEREMEICTGANGGRQGGRDVAAVVWAGEEKSGPRMATGPDGDRSD